MRPLALLAAFALLAACTGGEADADAAVPAAGEGDACGAGRHQWLVGRPRSDIPPRQAGADWRIACTGCPITMDHRPERMNIFYDERSGTIEEVRCG